MIKKWSISLLMFLLVFIGLLILRKYNQNEKEIHYHAGFQVYKDGILQDFSAAKYMTISPCDSENNKQEEDKQLEKAHLHDRAGDVVHVEADGAKWKDLFINLDYKLDSSKMNGYVNGNKTNKILESPIKSYDSVIFFIGNVNNSLLKNGVSKERIIQVEKETKTC